MTAASGYVVELTIMSVSLSLDYRLEFIRLDFIWGFRLFFRF